MPRVRVLITITLLLPLLAACSSAVVPANKPNDREWNLLTADYQWLETLRKSQAKPAANASRKQMIEAELAGLEKLQPTYNAFEEKLGEYYGRTGDPRATKLMAREKILLGDDYMGVLSRYDRALEAYRAALAVDPENPDAAARIAMAEGRRFVAITPFANIKSGMKESDVRGLIGLPREDWIKQVVQNSRVYSVWIYPKSDGGAAAVYFDNGVVYHTNWNAAAPAAPQTK
jgi:tetratricopeptide (TPR) repeat protein